MTDFANARTVKCPDCGTPFCEPEGTLCDCHSYPPDCPCGARWDEVKCYPPDGIGICSVCGRCTEEA
jgi:hypothetical protein